MLWFVLDMAGQVTLSCLIVYHLVIIFWAMVLDNLTENEINSIGSLLDIMFIMEWYSVLPDHFELSVLQITNIITSSHELIVQSPFILSICCTVPSIFCIICSFCVQIKIIIIYTAFSLDFLNRYTIQHLRRSLIKNLPKSIIPPQNNTVHK